MKTFGKGNFAIAERELMGMLKQIQEAQSTSGKPDTVLDDAVDMLGKILAKIESGHKILPDDLKSVDKAAHVLIDCVQTPGIFDFIQKEIERTRKNNLTFSYLEFLFSTIEQYSTQYFTEIAAFEVIEKMKSRDALTSSERMKVEVIFVDLFLTVIKSDKD